MDVEFRSRKMRKQYEDHREAEKAHGKEVARRYIERVNIIREARDMDELKRLPGLRCHPLKGDREGQWAMKLTGFHRLIFSLQGKRLEIARIEEVSKHYDN